MAAHERFTASQVWTEFSVCVRLVCSLASRQHFAPVIKHHTVIAAPNEQFLGEKLSVVSDLSTASNRQSTQQKGAKRAFESGVNMVNGCVMLKLSRDRQRLLNFRRERKLLFPVLESFLHFDISSLVRKVKSQKDYILMFCTK